MLGRGKVVTLAGQEIQRNLRAFVKRWTGYAGGERAEAQTFLNELFAAYGTERLAAGVTFEADQPRPSGAHGFLDAWWPGQLLVEMKRPSEAGRLDQHRQQAIGYWQHSSDPVRDRPAARYVVICAFAAFEVWEPGRYPLHPRATLTLDELPDRYEALLFLAGQRPLFLDADRTLTTQAAQRTVELHERLAARQAAEGETLMGFTLQTVWTLFASSLGMLGGHPVRGIVDSLLADDSGSRSSAAELGHLYTALAEEDIVRPRQGGFYANAVYVNGGLVASPARVHLERDELLLLADIASSDWSQVAPTIFGSLIEGFVPRDPPTIATTGQRTQFGVHYTHEADIAKIVQPTIVEPWTERIETAASVPEAVAALTALCALRVLDPACGSGNFLYVAYRELRELERVALERIATLAAATGVASPEPGSLPQYPLANLYGLEIDPFAVRVARLVLWMGHKLASDRHGTPEAPLPLPDLDRHIVGADALKEAWPPVDVVIGNPPFNGSQYLRRDLPGEYVEWLARQFGIGVRDYCTYWFRRAADHLPDGGRAGLVGTKSIAQDRGREASLDYVIATGGVITDAVSRQPWPGEANVHVSIVNWVQRPENLVDRFILDLVEVPDGIAADLVPIGLSKLAARTLEANQGVSFQGAIPGNEGFLLAANEASALLQREEADYGQVVRPYLSGRDIAQDPRQAPTRWVIDFGDRPLEECERWPAALAVVRDRVRPDLRGSTLKSDPAYTPTTVFATFAWPPASPDSRERIAEAARRIAAERVVACDAVRGLTDVYNLMEDGGYGDLAAAHRELDLAVAGAYGWPATVVGDAYEVVPRLLRLNLEIAAGRMAYDPFPERQTTVARELTLSYEADCG